MKKYTNTLLILLHTVFFVSGCATNGQDKPAARVVNYPAEAARNLKEGNFSDASDLYAKMAYLSTVPREKLNFQLLAVETLLDNGLYQPKGRIKLIALPNEYQSPPHQNRYKILKAKEALINGDPTNALNLLPKPERVNIRKHLVRLFILQADAYSMLEVADQELNTRVNLHLLLSSEKAISTNQQKIWNLLDKQSTNNLRQMTTNLHGDTYQGWLELALILRSKTSSAKKLSKQVESWKRRFTQHPASGNLSSQKLALALSSIPENSFADSIAVILPLTGKTASVATTIRDGIISAFLENSDVSNLPQVKFYNSTDDDFENVYNRSVREGADVVIGPLNKLSVNQLSNASTLPVPTLALNYQIPKNIENLPPNLTQFGLLPEDEAVSAALRALKNKFKRALIIGSDDILSNRLATAFRKEFEMNGGIIIGSLSLPKEKFDYSKQLREALHINQSRQRHRTLQSVLSNRLKFEPTIRQDIDVIYLTTDNQQARLIRPQLLFFRAKEIPLLASSRLNEQLDSAKKTRDLDGVVFSEIAWALSMDNPQELFQTNISTNWPEKTNYAKFFALGADAYNILPFLAEMKENPEAIYLGYTGELSLEENYRLQRKLSWATFEKSSPVPLIETKKETVLGRQIQQ